MNSTTDSPARRTWDARPLRELTRHITESFHDPLNTELPRLLEVARHVEQCHGSSGQPSAGAIAAALDAFVAGLLPHIKEEDDDIFPLIESIEDGAAGAAGARRFLDRRPGLERDHENAAQALAGLRALTGGYTAPAGSCRTTQGLYNGLGELEALMHLHVHLEHTLLYPRAEALALALR